MTILSILIIGYFTDINEDYQIFVKNWETDPLVEIDLLTTSQHECKVDWESLFVYKFSGTVEGCYCKPREINPNASNQEKITMQLGLENPFKEVDSGL